MWFDHARFFNATVAVLAALAWFTGTHHCLLGLMNDNKGRVISGCHCSEPSKGSGASSKIPSRIRACCDGLLSPSTELAYAKVKFSPVLMWFDPVRLGHLVPVQSPHRTLLRTEYDTGPPVGNFFFRIVLKRSLRENAPPLRT